MNATTITTAADLAATIPSLLGFHPEESVVFRGLLDALDFADVRGGRVS